MIYHIALLLVGLVILGVGGEALVQGAAKLARSLGISALVVGLTIVAFGTSAPELAVSVTACLQNSDSLAIGNAVGSNIANILLVLGLAALVKPLVVSLNIVKVDAPIMLGASLLLMGFALAGGALLRWHGVVLTLGLLAYVYCTYRFASGEPAKVVDEYEAVVRSGKSRVWFGVLILVGLVGLKYGADLIVLGAIGIAQQFGLSERVIGMTIVAIGTSLPEIATCLVAARRDQPDIAIGNVVGSNIFNILSVLGIATLVAAPVNVEADALRIDLPVMLGATVLCLPLMWTGRRITRPEGGVLLGLYVVYLGYVLTSGGPPPAGG